MSVWPYAYPGPETPRDVYEWFDPAVELELGRRGRRRASEYFMLLEALCDGDVSLERLKLLQRGPLVRG